MEAFLELVNSAYLSYISAQPEDKRDLVKTVMSNFSAAGKSVLIKLKTPFEVLVERPSFTYGSPQREACRTDLAELREIFKKLYEYFSNK